MSKWADDIAEKLGANANVAALAEAVGMNSARIKAMLEGAGMRRDTYRKYPTRRALEILEPAADMATTIGNRITGEGPVADAGSEDRTRRTIDRLELVSVARAASEQERARKLRLQNDQLEGKLVARDTVEATMRDLTTRAKLSLAQIGQRVAPLVAGKTDLDEIQNIVNAEIRKALIVLSDASTLDDEALR